MYERLKADLKFVSRELPGGLRIKSKDLDNLDGASTVIQVSSSGLISVSKATLTESNVNLPPIENPKTFREFFEAVTGKEAKKNGEVTPYNELK